MAQALVSGGQFVPGYLGVTIQPAIDGSAGAVVTQVVPGTAAAAAGVQVDDRVIRVNGAPIADEDDLGAHIGDREAGDAVELVLVRDGVELVLEVELGERTPEVTP